MKHDLVIAAPDKAMSRLFSSVKKDVSDTVAGNFAPVTIVVRNVGRVLTPGTKVMVFGGTKRSSGRTAARKAKRSPRT